MNRLSRMISGELWRMSFRRRLRKHPPVFVYQMGKVSSRSVFDPLSSVYNGLAIHDHAYGDRAQGETKELARYINSRKPPERVYIISLTREPISRNISAFFANLKRDTGHPYESGRFTIEELKEKFLLNFTHDQPLEWFDRSIKANFGIDVYQTEFASKGYSVIEKAPFALLTMRMELRNEEKSRLVNEFLGLKGFAVSSANQTSDKPYGALYRDFKSNVKFDAAFVAQFSESRYVRHFYSPEFIEKTSKCWTEGLQG